MWEIDLTDQVLYLQRILKRPFRFALLMVAMGGWMSNKLPLFDEYRKKAINRQGTDMLIYYLWLNSDLLLDLEGIKTVPWTLISEAETHAHTPHFQSLSYFGSQDINFKCLNSN